MTNRSYADLRALSPDGRLRLEALSPDNGNDLVRNGVAAVGRGHGVFQRSFRYQLLEVGSERVVWERWQAEWEEEDEPSPVEAWVSDAGHAVVVAHYLSWSDDELLFIAPDGRLRLSLRVAPGLPDAEDADSYPDRRSDAQGEYPILFWVDPHVNPSTGGPRWRGGSFITFPRLPSLHFCWRTGWGRRIVVDLERMEVLDDSAHGPLLEALRAEEARRALAALNELTEPVVEGRADHEQHWLLIGAIAIAVEQRIREAIPFLKKLEQTHGGSRTSSHVFGESCSIERHSQRALARLALRHLGEEPAPGGNYAFLAQSLAGSTAQESAPAIVLAEGSRDVGQRAQQVALGSRPREVAAVLGAPDRIELQRRMIGTLGRFWLTSEIWEYEGPDATTRLIWSFPEQKKRSAPAVPCGVECIEVVAPPGWADPQRVHDEVLGRYIV